MGEVPMDSAKYADLSEKEHWSVRPWPLLLFAIAAQSIIYMAYLALIWVFYLTPKDNFICFAGIITIWMTLFAVFELFVGLTFYLIVRKNQRKSGLCNTAPWKAGIAFYLGLLLAAVYFYLIHYADAKFPTFIPATSAMIREIADAFVMALIFCLLFPVFEKRFGMVRTVLLACAFFGALSLIKYQVKGINQSLIELHMLKSYSPTIQVNFFTLFREHSETLGIYPYLGSSIKDTSLAAMYAGLYLLSRRRIPGTFILFDSVPGFLDYLYNLRPMPSATLHPFLHALINYSILDYSYHVILLITVILILRHLQNRKMLQPKESTRTPEPSP